MIGGVPVDLVIPVKGLLHGKSRLRAALGPDTEAHAELVLALALDTATAAASSPPVRRVLAVTSDTAVAATLLREGIEVLPERAPFGLNRALRQGATALRESGQSGGVVGALQADLPALRAAELADAITEAAGARACCVDRHGTGTTLLLSAAGEPLDPSFGAGSAVAHLASGAAGLAAPLPSLRCDVDTAADLVAARALGVGPRTATLTGKPTGTEAMH